MPDQTSQAPVAGADPRADGWVKWRELAGLLERGCDSADAGDEWPSFAPGTLRTVAAALRDAAEAVTEARARERAALRLAHDAVARVRDLSATRAREPVCDAWAVLAPAGGVLVVRESVSALHVHARRQDAESAARASSVPATVAPVHLSHLAPRPSAGPAAPCGVCGGSGFVGPLGNYTICAACNGSAGPAAPDDRALLDHLDAVRPNVMGGNRVSLFDPFDTGMVTAYAAGETFRDAVRNALTKGAPAARASDDPAPTTRECRAWWGVCDAGASVVHNRHVCTRPDGHDGLCMCGACGVYAAPAAAPAAPEVPRG